ncbi:MAG: addiction module killer protein [Nitrospira sp.]|nr:addiction module killer protein [Nitrospira sp.]
MISVRGRVFKSGSSGWRRAMRGDVRPVGESVSETRIDYGPGYRVYFVKHGREVVVLLAGGDKRTQATDIKMALRLAQHL